MAPPEKNLWPSSKKKIRYWKKDLSGAHGPDTTMARSPPKEDRKSVPSSDAHDRWSASMMRRQLFLNLTKKKQRTTRREKQTQEVRPQVVNTEKFVDQPAGGTREQEKRPFSSVQLKWLCVGVFVILYSMPWIEYNLLDTLPYATSLDLVQTEHTRCDCSLTRTDCYVTKAIMRRKTPHQLEPGSRIRPKDDDCNIYEEARHASLRRKRLRMEYVTNANRYETMQGKPGDAAKLESNCRMERSCKQALAGDSGQYIESSGHSSVECPNTAQKQWF